MLRIIIFSLFVFFYSLNVLAETVLEEPAEEPIENSFAGKYQGVGEFSMYAYEFNEEGFTKFFASKTKMTGKFLNPNETSLIFKVPGYADQKYLLEIKEAGNVFAIGDPNEFGENMTNFKKVDKFWWDDVKKDNYVGTWKDLSNTIVAKSFEFFIQDQDLILAIPARKLKGDKEVKFFKCQIDNGSMISKCPSVKQAGYYSPYTPLVFNSAEGKIYSLYGDEDKSSRIQLDVFSKVN